MSALRQAGAITAINASTIPSRLGGAAIPVVGAAVVVAVLIAVLAMSAGIARMAVSNGHADHAIVLSSGAADELMSSISRDQVTMIANAPGIRRGAGGQALMQPEAAVLVEVNNKSDGSPANILFKGTGPTRFALSPELRLAQGRMFRPGLREIVVGRSAARQYRNLAVGDRIRFRGAEWTVVGQYEAGGSLAENGILGDAETVMSAFDRPVFQSVAVGLTSPGALPSFHAALDANPSLHVDVVRETDYVARQVKAITALLDFVAYFVAGVMAAAATFAIMNSIYTSVDTRARELATLRALGFGGAAVIMSTLGEALMLALPGGALGAAIVWLLFNGRQIDTIGIAFPLTVTPGIVVVGFVWAAAMGLLAGLLPALRAASQPVATALRSA